MKDKSYADIIIPVIFITLYIALSFGCQHKDAGSIEMKKVNTEDTVMKEPAKLAEFAVEPPPFSDGIFPCTDCHADMVPNPVRRELVDMHDDISAMFNHDSENRWCLDCHDIKNRDYLRLASGKLLDFKESYKLCGQCHGEKYRDWKVGVHGKRTGDWNGQKEYFLCVNCHNPHAPKFQELKPEPPPIPQEDIK